MERRAPMAEQLINGQVIEACQQGDRGRLFSASSKLTKTRSSRLLSTRRVATGRWQKTLRSRSFFEVCLRRFGSFRGDSEFTTWLYRLVVNACLDERRRRRRLLPFESTQTTVAMSSVSDKKPQERHYARLEVSEAVRGAINELKPKFRLPILFEVHRGIVVRGDCGSDGLFEGNSRVAFESWSQSIGEAVIAPEQSRRFGESSDVF
jgi:RNA polymerase sigma-70 factor (ECF subfamily)